MKRQAASLGIIGIPDDKTIEKLEQDLGKPIKKIIKEEKMILLIGRGLFKKIVIPISK